jgi:hypothetical protein
VKTYLIIFVLALCLISSTECLHIENSPNQLTQDRYFYGETGKEIVDTTIVAQIRKILKKNRLEDNYPQIEILNPYHNSLFPREMASPMFNWEDRHRSVSSWLVVVEFETVAHKLCIFTDNQFWTPTAAVWETIKANSLASHALVTIMGVAVGKEDTPISKGCIAISTSRDPLDAHIFYREVKPLFSYSYKNPQTTQWRLGDIRSYDEAPIVMRNLTVCGNCHTFSKDGRTIGMDIDVNNDKGGYAIAAIEEKIDLKKENFISWNDFPGSESGLSMGLFSKVSPSGRYVVTTIFEKNFMVLMNDPNFSQLFLTVEGVLACYDTQTKRFFRLPGADDPNYVQTCPDWSPDGKYIVFCRAKVDRHLLKLIKDNSVTVTPDTGINDLNRKYYLQYDLFQVPFNGGKGGKPVPIKGASQNRDSNYLPRYSPDGRWIVFARSQTGLLLQPDSRLYIIPAKGGVARKMRCNTDIMNSWHSFSPNGKWMAFTSKVNTPLTEIFLTHIDANGNDSTPILLSRFKSKGFCANIPELVRFNRDIIKEIRLSPEK